MTDTALAVEMRPASVQPVGLVTLVGTGRLEILVQAPEPLAGGGHGGVVDPEVDAVRFRLGLLPVGPGRVAGAGPLVLTAWMAGIPVVLHEQNLLPGITNRIVGRLAARIFVSFAETARRFNRRKVVHTGNPVRRRPRWPHSHRARPPRSPRPTPWSRPISMLESCRTSYRKLGLSAKVTGKSNRSPMICTTSSVRPDGLGVARSVSAVSTR